MAFVDRITSAFQAVAADVKELYRRVGVQNLAALMASTVPFAVGTVVQTRAEGFVYEVVATGGNIITAGGVRLNVLPTAGGQYNVKAFGAKGDGATNDSAAFTAAGEFVKNASIFVPAGVYRIGDIRFKYGTTVVCEEANGQVSANANGAASGLVQFSYNGAGGVGSTVFYWCAETANNWLFGGGVIGKPVFRGNNLCEMSVRAASTSSQKFDMEARAFTYAGIKLDSGNGVLSVACRVYINYTYGTVAAVENSCGVILTGEVGNAGCTQHDIQTHGLVKHGDMVKLVGNCDNNRLFVHGARDRTGATPNGHAIGFYNGAVTHPRNNTIYDVAGPVFSDSLCFGNSLLRVTSEGTKITGTGQLHIGELVDYVDGRMYATPKYRLADKQVIGVDIGVIVGTATRAALGGSSVGVYLNMLQGSTDGIAFVVDTALWGKGYIRYINGYYSLGTAQTGAIRFRARASMSVPGVGAGPAERANVALTFAPPPAGRIDKAEILFPGTTGAMTDFDGLLMVEFVREAGHASDTVAATVRLHAVEIVFEGFGPLNSYTTPVVQMPDFRYERPTV